jgi:hypothetical protein
MIPEYIFEISKHDCIASKRIPFDASQIIGSAQFIVGRIKGLTSEIPPTKRLLKLSRESIGRNTMDSGFNIRDL